MTTGQISEINNFERERESESISSTLLRYCNKIYNTSSKDKTLFTISQVIKDFTFL